MSKEDIERFAADVKACDEMKEQVRGLGTEAAAIVKFANEKGYDFTEEELKEYGESKKGELSEEQLEKVAGGSAVAVATVAVAVEVI